MSKSLHEYYQAELVYIRQTAQEFAKQFPATANRLLLETNRSLDPHVERLLEAFAFLAGRVHHKLDDEFPELTDALLSVLYPHYLAPVPSMAIAIWVSKYSRLTIVIHATSRPAAAPATNVQPRNAKRSAPGRYAYTTNATYAPPETA